MNKENLSFDSSTNLKGDILKKLEDGVKSVFEKDSYKEFLRTVAKFTNYSYRNSLLIMLQKPNATYVAGYKSWQRNFDRQVLKGEKGIKILSPRPYKEERINPVTGKTELVERLTFVPTTVFDLSQTDGKPFPSPFKITILDGKVDNFESIKEAIVKASPLPVNFQDISDRTKANGFCLLADRGEVKKGIYVSDSLPEAQTLSTLIHEVVHAKLHRPGTDRQTAEVQAESIAFIVSDHLGLDTSSKSFEYVAAWSNDKTLPELKQSLDVIQKESAQLAEEINTELDVNLELQRKQKQEQKQDQKQDITLKKGKKKTKFIHL